MYKDTHLTVTQHALAATSTTAAASFSAAGDQQHPSAAVQDDVAGR